MNDWVTIASNVGPVEIAVLKDRFEGEGIAYFVKGENNPYIISSSTNWGSPFGGIEIQVRENDKQRALEILKETGYLDDSSPLRRV